MKILIISSLIFTVFAAPLMLARVSGKNWRQSLAIASSITGISMLLGACQAWVNSRPGYDPDDGPPHSSPYDEGYR
jgi:hypothetical protein